MESMQCEGRIKKGLGRRCKARTKRSKFCQAHLNCNQNLRITNSKIPNAGLGLFCGDRWIERNHPIVEYTGNADRRAGLCQVNSKIALKKGVPSLVSTKSIIPNSEIYTNYGRDYWRYKKNV